MSLELHQNITKAKTLRGIKQSVKDVATLLEIKISEERVAKIVNTLELWKKNSTSPQRLSRPDFLKQQDLTSPEKEIINELLDMIGFLILSEL